MTTLRFKYKEDLSIDREVCRKGTQPLWPLSR